MSSKTLRWPALAFAIALVGACTGDPTEPLPPDEAELTAPVMSRVSGPGSWDSYLIVAAQPGPTEALEGKVAALGATVTKSFPQVGVVVAGSSSGEFAERAAALPGVLGVAANVTAPWTPKRHMRTIGSDASSEIAGDGLPPDDDFFFFLQWGHDAVDAPQAWSTGHRGSGAQVAVLDGGYDLTHPDLFPNVNFGLSQNFVAGEALQYNPAFDPSGFSHGSHVAGIVAAADNAFGSIGIAPDAELVLIKVLDDSGSGSFADIIDGILYAASVGVDVINMSLGLTVSHRGEIFDQDGDLVARIPARFIQPLIVSVDRATTYAYQSGVTVITSAGNAATNGDRDKDRVHIPSDGPNVISVSATRPIGWALDPFTDLDVPASYTNYGRSVISFAAPGGDFDFSVPGLCFFGIPCFVFDGVFSLTYQGWAWAGGTSMAAPHVAGVAALVIGKNGGSMHPVQVERALQRSADDLGQPGRDQWFGMGRVNAYRAVN